LHPVEAFTSYAAGNESIPVGAFQGIGDGRSQRRGAMLLSEREDPLDLLRRDQWPRRIMNCDITRLRA
jgi:hypothetical protein